MERCYAPYIKWFGTAFAQLPCAKRLLPVFREVLAADSWEERQRHLVVAYESVAGMHNALGITAPLSAKVSPYFNRLILVVDASRFSEAIRATITNEEVRALPENLGSVDQFLDSTDALRYLEKFRRIYR
jgi:hypothetical protein